MKKIYVFIGALVVTSVALAQDFTKKPLQKCTDAYLANKANHQGNLQITKTSAINEMVSPAEGILTTKNIAATDYDYFASPVLCDSTLIISDASGDFKPDCALGYVLDPKSFFVRGDGTQILDASTPYTIDSVFIPSFYNRVAGSTATDTVYTYLTYIATTPSNTAVNLNLQHSQLWVAPMASWTGTLAAMRITNVNAAAGIPVAPVTAALPATVRVKTLLTASSPTFGVAVKLPTPLNVPAGRCVAAYYTYVPGEAHTNGEVYFSFTGGAPATQNGFAGLIAQQTAAVTVAADISDMFNCPDGTSHTLGWDKKSRYNQGTNSTLILHQLLQDVIMEFHVKTISVGLEDLENKGFALGQNSPNPYSNTSSVKFALAKDVNSAVFTVTDIMGRVISSENVGTTTGSHTVNLGAYAAGVYYYSLNVDGNVTTKKMIVE